MAGPEYVRIHPADCIEAVCKESVVLVEIVSGVGGDTSGQGRRRFLELQIV